MQYTVLLVAAALGVTVSACAVDLNLGETQSLSPEASETVRIQAVIEQQQSAWNAGDIDGFMQGYWQSPELRFASGGTVTYGWQDTRDGYHARYSDRAKMGRLTFSDLTIDPLSTEAAIVHGRWALEREADRPSGLFTLIFRQVDGDWKIVSDTTTSAD